MRHLYPEKYHTNGIQEMKTLGAEIVRVPGNYEDAVIESSRVAQDSDYYDANPGGTNTVQQLRGYAEIANEIYDELRDSPAVVAVPVSNGTTLAGIYKGFMGLYRRGKISRLPRLVPDQPTARTPSSTPS
jgi:threonine synthase